MTANSHCCLDFFRQRKADGPCLYAACSSPPLPSSPPPPQKPYFDERYRIFLWYAVATAFFFQSCVWCFCFVKLFKWAQTKYNWGRPTFTFGWVRERGQEGGILLGGQEGV